MAPMGKTRAEASLAWDRMNSVTDRLSFTGFVFGMQQTEVNPPAFAAAVPVAIVSLYSKPGSRRCTCMSMRPGTTSLPAASMTCAPFGRDGTRFAELRDLAVGDEDIELLVNLVRRIDHVAVFDENIHKKPFNS